MLLSACIAGDSESTPVAPPKIGEFSWHELATTEQPGAAFEFYSTLFGWEKVSEFDMGPVGIYLIFGRNGTQLGGMFNKGDMGKPGSGVLGVLRAREERRATPSSE